MIKINNLNNAFVNNIKKLLGDEFDEYINSFSIKHYKGIRANTLKINKNELKKLLNETYEDIKWCEDAFYYEDDFRPAKLPFYNAGLYYIQEPSAMLPVEVLDIQKGDFVLDMCGAPGGKSTQILSKMRGNGLLVSNDYSASRSKIMAKNIELMGATNFIVLAEEQAKLKKRFTNFFDKILIDAPCSGEGMFRKDSNLAKNWSEDDVYKYSSIQKDLLDNAKDMVKTGGQIVYSTCTLNTEENEEVILDFINKNPQFILEKIHYDELGVSSGLGRIIDDELNKTARVFPHRSKGEGHFVAKLKKITDTALENETNTNCKNVKIKGLEFFNEFVKNNLNIELLREDYLLKLHGTSLFLVHNNVYDMKNIRVIRSGFYLGELKKNRFEPSQSLALSLSMEDFKNVLNLKRDDILVSKYLKGETLQCDCNDGWILICIEGYPLGFGKSNKGKIKNKYDIKFMNN